MPPRIVSSNFSLGSLMDSQRNRATRNIHHRDFRIGDIPERDLIKMGLAPGGGGPEITVELSNPGEKAKMVKDMQMCGYAIRDVPNKENSVTIVAKQAYKGVQAWNTNNPARPVLDLKGERVTQFDYLELWDDVTLVLQEIAQTAEQPYTQLELRGQKGYVNNANCAIIPEGSKEYRTADIV